MGQIQLKMWGHRTNDEEKVDSEWEECLRWWFESLTKERTRKEFSFWRKQAIDGKAQTLYVHTNIYFHLCDLQSLYPEFASGFTPTNTACRKFFSHFLLILIPLFFPWWVPIFVMKNWTIHTFCSSLPRLGPVIMMILVFIHIRLPLFLQPATLRHHHLQSCFPFNRFSCYYLSFGTCIKWGVNIYIPSNWAVDGDKGMKGIAVQCST